MKMNWNASPGVVARNPNLFPPPPECSAQAPEQPKRKPKLNKAEAAYLERLRAIGYAHIYVQDITLRIGDDTRFTVDFVTVDPAGRIFGHEVKGFMRDDARVKLHVAARMYPWISFVLARKSKGGAWDVTPVPP